MPADLLTVSHGPWLVSAETRAVLREGIRLVVAAVWLAAGVAKLRSPTSARDAVQRLVGLPARAAAPVARLLPWLEIGIGLLLLVAVQVRLAATASAVLFVLFAALIGRVTLRDAGLGGGCGCFGGARTVVREVDPHAGPRAIARNMVLAALAVVVAGAG